MLIWATPASLFTRLIIPRAIGLPEALIAVPDTLETRAGASAKLIYCASCPMAPLTRPASAGDGVPG